MPLTKIAFAPGLQKDESKLAAEGRWVDGDKVRFRGGVPETLGGWDNAAPGQTFAGVGRGIYAWSSLDGRRFVAWGTATKLYVLTGGVIYDITPAGLPAGNVDGMGEPGGYGTSTYGSGGYGSTVAADKNPRTWSLDGWGQNLLALPQGGSLYQWVPPAVGSSPTAATVVTGAPTRADAMFVAPERVCVLLGTHEFGGTNYNALLVRWSDQEDLVDWTPTASNLSGEQPLTRGSYIVSGVATRQQNLVWTDDALYTMQFTGDPATVFRFDLAGTGCGLSGPLAKVEYNGAAFWKSRNAFFTFQGSAPQEIPCTVKSDIFENTAVNQEGKTAAGLNGGFSEITWFYADARDGNECSRYVTYNYAENHWTSGTFNRSSWARSGVFDHPIALGTDGLVYYHERGNTANGGTISAFLESAYFDVEDGQNLMQIRRIVPDFDGQQGAVSFTFGAKLWPSGTERSAGAYTALPTKEKLDMRVTARQMKVRMESNASPSYWRLGALRFDMQRSGATR